MATVIRIEKWNAELQFKFGRFPASRPAAINGSGNRDCRCDARCRPRRARNN
jgi:hypothetical protein